MEHTRRHLATTLVVAFINHAVFGCPGLRAFLSVETLAAYQSVYFVGTILPISIILLRLHHQTRKSFLFRLYWEKSGQRAAVGGLRGCNCSSSSSAAAEFGPMKEWEVRPGGLLVQKRAPEADPSAAPVPTVCVKVKHGAGNHEIRISSQATFGELKKVLSARTGLHPLDMKLVYRDKARESNEFLDTAGVKDKSKVVLVEDPVAQAKRLLEMRKSDMMEKAARSVSTVTLEVDRLATKASALEAIVNRGGRVAENDVTDLIDSLMNELIKLDAVVADGDAKLQRRMQMKRVQKYVETLDAIKIKNSSPRANGQSSKQQHHRIQPQHQEQMQQKRRDLQQTHPRFQQQPVVVTKNWETFESLFAQSTSATITATSSAPHASFDWELF
ncbi:unnamed protein product [Musa banksii]